MFERKQVEAINNGVCDSFKQQAAGTMQMVTAFVTISPGNEPGIIFNPHNVPVAEMVRTLRHIADGLESKGVSKLKIIL